MKKTILAGVVLIIIVFSPLSESRAGNYSTSPGIYFGINLEIPVYDKVWVPGHWEHFRGDWRWFDGYWVKRRYARDHRAFDKERRQISRERWIQGHWERRHGDRIWVAGHWKNRHKPAAYQSNKLEKRARYWEEHDRDYSRR
jgi:hypothetical protein